MSRKAETVNKKNELSDEEVEDMRRDKTDKLLVPSEMKLDCVIDGRLFISSVVEAQNYALLKKHNVTHILTIGKDMPPLYPQDFTYQIIPEVEDTETDLIYPYLRSCFSFIDLCFGSTYQDKVNQNDENSAVGVVLVHCEGGVSRSAAVVVAYLMDRSMPSQSMEVCLAYMQSVRPVVNPNMGFRAQLSLFEESHFSLELEKPDIQISLEEIVSTGEKKKQANQSDTRETGNIFHSKLFSEPSAQELLAESNGLANQLQKLTVNDESDSKDKAREAIVPLIVPELLQKNQGHPLKSKGAGAVSMDDISLLSSQAFAGNLEITVQRVNSDRKHSEVINLPGGKNLLLAQKDEYGKKRCGSMMSIEEEEESNLDDTEADVSKSFEIFHPELNHLSDNLDGSDLGSMENYSESKWPRVQFDSSSPPGSAVLIFDSYSPRKDEDSVTSPTTSSRNKLDARSAQPPSPVENHVTAESTEMLDQLLDTRLNASAMGEDTKTGARVQMASRSRAKRAVSRSSGARSGRDQPLRATSPVSIEQEQDASDNATEEQQAQSEAAQVVAKVLLGHDTTDNDAEHIRRFLAFSHQPISATKVFQGIKQALRMIRKLGHIADVLDSTGNDGNEGYHLGAFRSFFESNGLRKSLESLGGQLESYTGQPINSREFLQLLRSEDGLKRVVDNLDAEYSSALQAIKSGPDSPRLKPIAVPSSFSGDSSLEKNSIFEKDSPVASRQNRGAQIDLLLLFAKLGLRRDLNKALSDESYKRMAQMLEGGTKERAALESINQTSLIELLAYLDHFTSTSNLRPNSKMLRLKRVCEARLALMVEKDTVKDIFDHLVELKGCVACVKSPRGKGSLRGVSVESSVRKVANYCLYFTSAMLGERLLRVLENRANLRKGNGLVSVAKETCSQEDQQLKKNKPQVPGSQLQHTSSTHVAKAAPTSFERQNEPPIPQKSTRSKRRSLRRWVTFNPESPEGSSPKNPVELAGKNITCSGDAFSTELPKIRPRGSTTLFGAQRRSPRNMLASHRTGSAGKLVPADELGLEIARIESTNSSFGRRPSDQTAAFTGFSVLPPQVVHRNRQYSINSGSSFVTENSSSQNTGRLLEHSNLFPFSYYDAVGNLVRPEGAGSISRTISTGSNVTNEHSEIGQMMLQNRDRRNFEATELQKLHSSRNRKGSMPKQRSLNPLTALKGILRHLSRLTGSRLSALSRGDLPSFDASAAAADLQQKLAALHQHSATLKDTHPIICVADNETRPGLSLLPKASDALRKYVIEDKNNYGLNQTPYIFDFGLKVLVFFKPSDHDTALQQPNDTSAKFRKVLKSIFRLLPEGFDEVVLNDLTETATFSQHASAGFALSTVLHYIDRIIPEGFEKFGPQLRLGDDREGVSGTVAGGYLHCVESKPKAAGTAKTSTSSLANETKIRYVFTEESGHYGRRWTKPGVRSALAEFMEDSGLKNSYILKPYHRQQEAGSILDIFGESAVDVNRDCVRLKKAETAHTTLPSSEGLLEDFEWDFD